MNIRIRKLRSGSVPGSVPARRSFALLLCVVLLASLALPTLADSRSTVRQTPGTTASTLRPAEKGKREGRRDEEAVRVDQNQDGYTVGVPSVGEVGIQKTTKEIMAEQSAAPVEKRKSREIVGREFSSRKDPSQNPDALAVASIPTMVDSPTSSKQQRGVTTTSQPNLVVTPNAPQTPSINFTGATLAD